MSAGMSPMERLLLYGFLAFVVFPREVSLSFYYPTVFWTPNNCLFSLNKPNQTGGKGFYFRVKPNSHMMFVCPNVAIRRDKSHRSPSHRRMNENLLMVDKESYDTCSVKNISGPHHNREVLRCDQDPKTFKYTEEIFAMYRAFTDKVKYTFGKDYYFISTSDGTIRSLNNTSGGHCKTHHMKLHIYVCNYTEKCQYEMPECPFPDEDIQTEHQTDFPIKTTSKVKEQPQSGSPIWLSNSMHVILHIVAVAVILLLIVILVCVVSTYRKKTKEKRSLNPKTKNSANEGKPILRQDSDNVPV